MLVLVAFAAAGAATALAGLVAWAMAGGAALGAVGAGHLGKSATSFSE